jgi:hypothetical protein
MEVLGDVLSATTPNAKGRVFALGGDVAFLNPHHSCSSNRGAPVGRGSTRRSPKAVPRAVDEEADHCVPA